MGQIHMP